jgi:spore coat protein JC
MRKGAIFDVDGTLLDSMPIWENSSATWLASIGKQAAPDLNDVMFRLSLDEGAAYLKSAYHLSQSEKEIKEGGFDAYFTDHTVGIWPANASGVPWSAGMIQSLGDPLADLAEDMGAEQKARVTYDNILKLVDDPDVCDVIRFLREREIVHFQRFGEAMGMVRDKLNEKNFYAFNPAYPLRK